MRARHDARRAKRPFTTTGLLDDATTVQK